MAVPKFVEIPSHPLARFEPILGEDYGRIEEAAARARRLFVGRAIWHVSSTLRGGGIAEMLRSLLPYVRGAGIDTRWVVLREQPEFFALTKRLHNNLHGVEGDGGDLGPRERRLYESTLATSAPHLLPLVQEGDVVFLHDPQTVGLAAAARAAGATVVWRCHIGVDRPNDLTRRAWAFLAPHVRAAELCVFSRDAYVWDVIDRERARTMAPWIDPVTPKNQELEPATVEAILGAIGLGDASPATAPAFTRADGTPGRVERGAEIWQEARLPKRAPTVIQVSRWDRLKDHRGLLDCFSDHLSGEDLHLVLAGPASGAVADDPEGATVWSEMVGAWEELPGPVRHRVHLLSLPMHNLDENGAMVNALQRRGAVIVQKSLAEGFGLTVAEAMWKRRPVIGTRVGGIQDQIEDGVNGVLIDDPRDLAGLGAAIAGLLADPRRAEKLGAAARRRVLESYLGASRLAEYVDLLAAISP
ncbi:MAG TPA: glycosyltransferase [Solirubrobacterales bacterium]|nr:glycosyltransferase [Solirubrobacterales bacterium]